MRTEERGARSYDYNRKTAWVDEHEHRKEDEDHFGQYKSAIKDEQDEGESASVSVPVSVCFRFGFTYSVGFTYSLTGVTTRI